MRCSGGIRSIPLGEPCRRMRYLIGGKRIGGTVQADEIFIGGKRSKAARKAVGTNKSPFLVGVEEGAKEQPRFVTFEELEAIYDEQILAAIENHVKKVSKIKPDGSGAYEKVLKKGCTHERSVYVNDPQKTAEHLRWVNMLTSNLKRFLLSTYHGVFPKYRKAYLAEFAYRFNRRYCHSKRLIGFSVRVFIPNLLLKLC
jgi:hypothetical protein